MRRVARACFLMWMGAAAACAPVPLTPTLMRPATEATAQARVVILKSGSNPMFDGPIEGFLTRFEGHAEVLTLEPHKLREAQAAVQQFGPSLVFCLGNSAAHFARDHIKDVPVLFALVSKEHALGVDKLPNFMGISMEPRPAAAFAQFRMVAPSIRRVVAYYKPQNSQQLIAQARRDLQEVGLELLPVPVMDINALKANFLRNVTGVDAVWLPADPAIMNDAGFAFLRRETLARHMALLTSLTERFAEAGALMSASVDLTSLGSQAAFLSRSVLDEGVTPASLGVQSPIGVILAVNLETAKAINIQLDAKVLAYVNRVFSETHQ